MASLHYSSTLTPSSVRPIHRPGVPASSLSFIPPAGCNSRNFINFRFEKEIRRQVKQRLNLVLASRTNPSDSSDDSKSSGSAEGPPLLTILAGLVVFLFFFWIIVSIVTWLIGLIVHPPLK